MFAESGILVRFIFKRPRLLAFAYRVPALSFQQHDKPEYCVQIDFCRRLELSTTVIHSLHSAVHELSRTKDDGRDIHHDQIFVAIAWPKQLAYQRSLLNTDAVP